MNEESKTLQQISFLLVVKPRLSVSGKLCNEWWRGQWEVKGFIKKALMGKQRDELDQVMSHLRLKMRRKFTAQVIIQCHRAIQPLTAISWLAKAILKRSQIVYQASK